MISSDKNKGVARGWQESDEELGLVMGELRVLSLDFVQAQAL